MVNIFASIVTNVLAALYQAVGFSVLLAILLMFLYLYVKKLGGGRAALKDALCNWKCSILNDSEFRRLFLLAFYTAMILFRTLLTRYIWKNPLSNVMGGWTLTDANGELSTEPIENLMLFVPFTILLLWALKDKVLKDSTLKIILWQSTKIVFFFSLSIEFLQLLLRLGTFQISDIFYNTLGGFIGGLMYWIAVRALQHYKHSKRKEDEGVDSVCGSQENKKRSGTSAFTSESSEKKCIDPLMTRNPYANFLFNGEFDMAEAYRKATTPKKLYKFVWLEDESRADGTENADGIRSNEKKFLSLRNNQIWVSSVDKMNDPYEFQCMYVDEKRLKDAGYPDELIEFFKNLLYKDMKQLGVSCLSAVPTEENLPMWSYYANTHKGFCIEYDVVSPECIYGVSYEPGRVPVAVLLDEMRVQSEKYAKGEKTDPAKDKFLFAILKSQLFMKHESWSHEREYRVISYLEKTSGLNVDIEKVGLKVNRVIGGLKCSDGHMKILNEISNQLGLGNAFQIEISSDSYMCAVRQK